MRLSLTVSPPGATSQVVSLELCISIKSIDLNDFTSRPVKRRPSAAAFQARYILIYISSRSFGGKADRRHLTRRHICIDGGKATRRRTSSAISAGPDDPCRIRLDQLLSGHGSGGAVRRLQDERLWTRVRAAASRRIPERQSSLDQDRVTSGACKAYVFFPSRN